MAEERPAEPVGAFASVWYSGWEVGYDAEAAKWVKDSTWRAYKGGVDIDAPEVSGATYDECLDAIDEQEDD